MQQNYQQIGSNLDNSSLGDTVGRFCKDLRAFFGGSLISHLILPSQDIPLSVELQKQDIEARKQLLQSNSYKTLSIRTPDSLLEAFSYNHRPDAQGKGKSVVIFFPGNAEVIRSNMIPSIARPLSANKTAQVILFNYAGVGNSSGRILCQDDLIQNGVAVLNYVQGLGYYPNQITLMGHSLGGAVATLTAAEFILQHKPYNSRIEEIGVFSDRSFQSIPHVVKNQFAGPQSCLLLHPIGWILYAITKGILFLTGWGSLNAGKAFKDLKHAACGYVESDQVIKGANVKDRRAIKFRVKSDLDNPPHDYNASHIADSHNMSLINLVDNTGQSMQEHLTRFINRHIPTPQLQQK